MGVASVPEMVAKAATIAGQVLGVEEVEEGLVKAGNYDCHREESGTA